MRAVDIIAKTRDKIPLTNEELRFWVEGYTSGDITDYQASAWCMAVLLNGLTTPETTQLTLHMANSGDTLDLHAIAPFVVDKHSTGGVGDTTTLVLAPLVASCGVRVPTESPRQLASDLAAVIRGFAVEPQRLEGLRTGPSIPDLVDVDTL